MKTTASLLSIVGRALSDFHDVNARAALVGGLAVGVHVLERTTRDADFAVAVETDEEAERITRDLVARGYRTALVLEQTDVQRLATVRLISPEDDRTMVDILYASAGIENEIVDAALPMELAHGLICPVASRGHLVALKVLARSDHRPQDDQDLGALLKNIEDHELEGARNALALVIERGYARSKNLLRDLDDVVRRFA
jgi:predicted nucleotidyltransferase